MFLGQLQVKLLQSITPRHYRPVTGVYNYVLTDRTNQSALLNFLTTYVCSWCVLFTVLLIIPLMILQIHVQILKFHETILRTAKMDEMVRLHDEQYMVSQ